MNYEELHQSYLQLQEDYRLLKFAKLKAEAKLQDLLRRLFGPKSEKLDPAQLRLALESIQADEAIEEEEPPVTKPEEGERKVRAGGGRRPLPENLPVERMVVDVPAAEREGMEKIREDVTEEIDYRPSQFIRRQIVRPVYASKSKDVAPVQAPAVKRVIPGSGVGTALIAHILVSRFCDHLPYYRQEQMAARQGVTLERQKLCAWTEHAALLLKTVHAQLKEAILKSGYVMADETPVKVRDPDKDGVSRQGWLWAYHAPTVRSVVFDFNLSRGQESPRAFFGSTWTGTVQTDGFAVYSALFGDSPGVEHAGCMAHARRAWVKAIDQGEPVVASVLAEIQKLYRIEAELKEATPEERSRVRGLRSTRILADLHRLCQQACASALPSSAVGKAAAYLLDRWPQLELFATPGHGHVLIDNNPVERGIRPVALGRKNWMFIGHPDAGWRSAVLYSIIGSCKLIGVNPYDYLVWVLGKLASASATNLGPVTPSHYLSSVKEQP